MTFIFIWYKIKSERVSRVVWEDTNKIKQKKNCDFGKEIIVYLLIFLILFDTIVYRHTHRLPTDDVTKFYSKNCLNSFVGIIKLIIKFFLNFQVLQFIFFFYLIYTIYPIFLKLIPVVLFLLLHNIMYIVFFTCMNRQLINLKVYRVFNHIRWLKKEIIILNWWIDQKTETYFFLTTFY